MQKIILMRNIQTALKRSECVVIREVKSEFVGVDGAMVANIVKSKLV